jgi:hypothetical protein
LDWIHALFSEADSKAVSRNDTTTVLFIAGVGRSGSTLLDRLLNEVEGYCALGETARFVWQRGLKDNQLCGSGKPFHEAPFWRAVFDDAFGGMDGLDPAAMVRMQQAVSRRRHVPQYLLEPLMTSSLRQALSPYTERMDALYRAIVNVSGAQVLGDTSKRPLEAYILARLPSVSVSVLHLVRDARAVAHSWQRKKERTEITGETVLMPQLEPLETARWWVGRNALAHSFQVKQFPYLRVRYEDLVASPGRTIENIAAFLGLQGERPEFGPEKEVHLGANHMLSGNPMRFDTGSIRVRADAAWKREMSMAAKRRVTSIAFPFLSGYGYPVWEIISKGKSGS